jgi:hypothetical protein
MLIADTFQIASGQTQRFKGPKIQGDEKAGQILSNSFTGFFERLFRTLCQDDP